MTPGCNGLVRWLVLQTVVETVSCAGPGHAGTPAGSLPGMSRPAQASLASHDAAARDGAGPAVATVVTWCTSDAASAEPLQAMGALTHGNVRVSLPRGTTQIPVAEFLAVLPAIVAGLRDMVGPPPEGPALRG
jgi:hypothetical protein